MSFNNQPNDKSVQLSVRLGALPPWTHPERVYWQWEWLQIRDALIGEVEVKRRSSRYLPKMQDMTKREYDAYIDRAVFYNMTRATVTKMVGSLMRRPAKLTGIPDKLNMHSVSKDCQDIASFTRMVATEMIAMGRVGVLLDMAPTGGQPYLAGYIAENIMDWGLVEKDGRLVLGEVVLREIRQDQEMDYVRRIYFASYRKLKLEQNEDGTWAYRQYFYTREGANADIDQVPTDVYTPSVNGVPFDFIPFMFFGSQSNLADIEISPVYDICKLNYSHYKSYAQLEHGRFYTALPVYYAPTSNGQEKGAYTLGPGVVWEVSPGEKPGLLEFHGQGLKTLENACDTKEAQIAALGGKLVDGGQRTGRTDAEAKGDAASEQSTLLAISLVLDTGITQLLQWMAMWANVDVAAVKAIAFETSKAFIFDSMGAREFRAIQSMYMDGVIPVEVVYDYLLRAKVIPDWMDIDTFKKYLTTPTHFPNQLDTVARMEGFPDSITKFGAEHPELDPAVQAVAKADILPQRPMRLNPANVPDAPSKVPAEHS